MTIADAETATLEAATTGGPTGIVLRAPMILGPGSRHLKSLEQLARLPVVPVPRNGAKRRPVWVGDISAALLAALEIDGDRLPKKPIDLAGAEPLSVGELIQAVAVARGHRGPRLLNVPLAGLKAVASVIEQLGFTPPAGKAAIAAFEASTPYDPRPATELLGWDPQPLRHALAQSLAKR